MRSRYQIIGETGRDREKWMGGRGGSYGDVDEGDREGWMVEKQRWRMTTAR